jgi:tRNA(Arg) A34 adenosine deaminase TadA
MKAGNGGPFGAVIVKDDKIIAEGWNRVTTYMDPTAHAEVTAIRDACKVLNRFNLSGCEIYTSCEPCPMCLAAIYWARIEKIYYANTRGDAAQIEFDDDFLYQELNLPIKQRKIPMIQVNHKEALAVFREWALKVDKMTY